ncbi:MAG: hypothetical protein HFJ42_08005 [Clostridia bacterium]|nr:hypothetical protein [Clostridia bacterium]
MIFSSNQIFEVSGNLSLSGELETALEFALKYSGNDKNMLQSEIDRGCKLVYQITENGKYCIGWGFENVPSGWIEYPFKFTIEKVSKIIMKHLEKFPIKTNSIWVGGSYDKGFLMKCNVSGSEVENPFYCIVSFEPYTCFYAK